MTDPRPPATRHRKSADQSIKETVESVIVAFILALTFRAYIVEAFSIPTGSMAPTLLGKHLRASCSQCDYRFAVDNTPYAGNRHATLTCPMCFFPNGLDSASATSAGDRILVQKFQFAFAEPRRWDVVVFKNPTDPFGGSQNFIKRLVGLPGETLMILDGNLYTRADAEHDLRIARKTDPDANPRWEAIQRDVFQPVYHSRFVPRDRGDSDARDGQTWRCPWVPQQDGWTLDDPAGYRFAPPDPGVAEQPAAPADGPGTGTQAPATPLGELRFRFTPDHRPGDGYAGGTARYPYNQPSYSSAREPLEDLRLAATVRPEADTVDIELRTTARLTAEPVPLIARFAADGTVTLDTQNASGQRRTLRQTTRPPFLLAGRDAELEFWVVDQELVIWIDGEAVLRQRYDLAYDELVARPAPPFPDELDLRLTVLGGAATLCQVELDRDLYYSQGAIPDRGGVLRSSNDGRVLARRANPVTLEPDHFFVLGDNSPHSEDSRRWNSVNEWVAYRHFAGRDGEDVQGRVPRDLLMGRAFFVYYPAPFALREGGAAVIPNFGAMRMIH